LWDALECSDCTLTRLVGIAETCKVGYKMKRDDPIANSQPKIHVSSDNNRAQKTHVVYGGNRNVNDDDSYTKSALCHKRSAIFDLRVNGRV
jgi:hypothetical protein